MERFSLVLSRNDFDTAIERLAVAPSLITRDRICTGFAGGGAAPDLEGMPGYGMLWTGSALPWWLRPLSLIAAARRCLVELTSRDGVAGFVRQVDPGVTAAIHSFPRELLPTVLEHMRRSGPFSDPGEVIDRDPTFVEFEFYRFSPEHDARMVIARYGRNCPSHLVHAVEGLDDFEDQEPFVGDY